MSRGNKIVCFKIVSTGFKYIMVKNSMLLYKCEGHNILF